MPNQEVLSMAKTHLQEMMMVTVMISTNEIMLRIVNLSLGDSKLC